MKKEEKQKRREIIKTMYEAGESIENIAIAIGRSKPTVRAELLAMGLDTWKKREKQSSSEKLYKAITIKDVNLYRDLLRVGDMVTVVVPMREGHELEQKNVKTKVLEISAHIVLTEEGCFQTKELALWNGLKV